MHRARTPQLVPLVVAGALAACTADNGDEGIFITKNVAPGDTCSFSADETEPFIPHGTLSVFSPGAYRLHPQMKSRISAPDDQLDQRTVIARGARVDIELGNATLEADLGGAAALEASGVTKFQSLFSAPIAPNGGITDAAFDLIPRALIDEILRVRPEITAAGAASFRVELIATAVVYGDMSGAEVTSQPFQFPVTLCNDCVANVLGPCPLPMTTPEVRPGNPCNPYQDGVADCCRIGDDVVCPALVATAAQ